MMNTQTRYIYFVNSFYTANKILSHGSKNPNFSFSVEGYEYFFNGHMEIYKAILIKKLGHIHLEINSVHFGLLNYHGYIPEEMRSEIIENKSTKALFGHMHSVIFSKFIESIFIGYEIKFWQEFIDNTFDIKNTESNKRAQRGHSFKTTFNIKQDHILEFISNLLDIDVKNISIDKNHIFKFRKKIIHGIGQFCLGRHTIGSHYYTSMCLGIKLTLTSERYVRLTNSLDNVKTSLKAKVPEMHAIFIVRIIDSHNLNFILGNAVIGLTTWILGKKSDTKIYRNNIS